MYKEIGSEFCLENINKLNINKDNMFNWSNLYRYSYYSLSGRNSIMFLLKELNIKCKTVLMPSYICESVIEAFLFSGFEVIFYNLDDKLNPVILEKHMNLKIGLFLHMGYYGYFTNEILNDFIVKLKKKDVIIIEDATHTLFSTHMKELENDFVIASIRKWFGIPSGGILYSNRKFNIDDLKTHKLFVKNRRDGLICKSEYMKTKNYNFKNQYLEKIRFAENILDSDYNIHAIDDLSKEIVNNYNYNYMISIRRKNYSYLAKQMLKIHGIKTVFKELPDNITPLFLPIYVNKCRNVLRDKLIEKKIYCPIHWPISKHLSGYINNSTQNIYDRILSIPCDQRYNTDDMQRIINTIKDVMQ